MKMPPFDGEGKRWLLWCGLPQGKGWNNRPPQKNPAKGGAEG